MKLSSQLYTTEASESKSQTEKELEVKDPDEKDFEAILANNEIKQNNAHSTKHVGK